MSWDWNDRDLTEWAKKTLPEFLLVCMQDPKDKKKSIAHTPWEHYECQVAEVHVDGECNLTGKKSHSLLQFDLDIGVRVDIEKREPKSGDGKEEEEPLYWPSVAQLTHFENYNMQPAIVTQFEEVPRDVSDEVGWYIREGMGQRYIWHGLARWHAYAVKKWIKVDQPAVEDPHRHPVPPPAFPPFKEDERRRYQERIKRELLADDEPWQAGLEDQTGGFAALEASASSGSRSTLAASSTEPFIGKKQVVAEEKPWETPPSSDDEEEEYDPTVAYEYDPYTFEKRRKGAPPKMRKFGKYPFLPSMLAGVGGPATGWLRPKEFAIEHPEWYENKLEDKKGGVTHVDMLMDKARKKREEIEKLTDGKQITMRATELCDAIEKGEIMKAFAKLDEHTTNCPHPQTGRCAAHYCVANKSKELLQMVIEARAEVNTKDNFGQTALMMAAKQGSNDLTKMLLDAGADATEEDQFGRSAGDMVKVLPVQPDGLLKNWREKMSGNPVPQDKAKASHELKDMIMEKERPKKYGQMLIDAINQKDVRTAESSIENGGDLSLTDEKGDTALLLLAKGKWKDQEGVQVRLTEKAHKAGGDLNFRNGQGNTPLLFAAHRGNQRLVERLLALKADATLANSEGNTALMYAAHGGNEAICTALLEAFAPAGAKNKFGLTAAGMAQKRGLKSCAVLVQAYEMAPKKAGLADEAPRKKDKKEAKRAFDYSKWDALEKEMEQDEQSEEAQKQKENAQAMKKPTPKMEDMGPEAFGLPPDTPWPPTDPNLLRKGPFDYSRWDRVVEDIEKHDKVVERYEQLQQKPQYEWRDGQKMQVIF